MKGLFIALEGSDGSGKSTILNTLKKYFRRESWDVVYTREPGGTPIGEKIRDILLDRGNVAMDPHCEALLYAASRAQHVHEKIIPNLEAGRIVVTDRYILSSLAYQGWARKLGISEVYDLSRFACGGVEADLTIFLDVDPITVLKRKARHQKPDRLEKAGNDFHRMVYEGYGKALPFQKRVVRIDASKPANLVAEEAWAAIKKAWEEKQ